MNRIEKYIFLILLILIILMSIMIYVVYLNNHAYFKPVEYYENLITK